MLNNLFLNNFDKQAAALFLAHRSDFGIKFFEVISFFGNWQFLLPAVFIIILILFFKNKKKFIVPFFLTVVVAEAITFFGKIYFGRSRPLLAVLHETDPSFPSGHATIAVAFYGYLAYMIIKLFPGRFKYLVVILSILIMFLIGFSRLYLDVHYVSDVVAGYLVGLSALIVGIIFSNRKIGR